MKISSDVYRSSAHAPIISSSWREILKAEKNAVKDSWTDNANFSTEIFQAICLLSGQRCGPNSIERFFGLSAKFFKNS